jgi:hypothetical protein
MQAGLDVNGEMELLGDDVGCLSRPQERAGNEDVNRFVVGQPFRQPARLIPSLSGQAAVRADAGSVPIIEGFGMTNQE